VKARERTVNGGGLACAIEEAKLHWAKGDQLDALNALNVHVAAAPPALTTANQQDVLTTDKMIEVRADKLVEC
jgi:hypothetical protein